MAKHRKLLRMCGSVSLVALGCGAALPVYAQDAETAEPSVVSSVDNQGTVQDAAAEGSDIIVTGTRVQSGFSASTPTNIIGAALVEQRQATNVADVLLEMPAFKPTLAASSNAGRSQQPGVSQADLRGLGASRTLFLVDGRRVVPLSNTSGNAPAPDMGEIPAMMIDRIDVVTGGASAQWGSDAVAGVINVVLKKRFDGLELLAQTGISTYGDGGSFRFAGLAGRSFADDRLHVLVSADYSKQTIYDDIYSRPWGRDEFSSVTNAGFATNGLPFNLTLPNIHNYSSPNMLITGPAGSPYRHMEFLPNGTLAPYGIGSIISGAVMVGGQGDSRFKTINIFPGYSRFSPYLRAQFDVSPDTSIYLDASYPTMKGKSFSIPSIINRGVIRGDNAFLLQNYPTVAAALGPNGSFTFNRLNAEFTERPGLLATVRASTPKIAIGAEGSLGGSWAWDGHASWGKNIFHRHTYDLGIKQNIVFATDAVLVAGVPTCRALVPGSATYNPIAAAGCVPINLFGSGSPSAEAIDYVTGDSIGKSVYTQKAAALNFRGDLFSTWAGPVAVAIGAEYRSEAHKVTADPISVISGFESSNSTQFSGSFNVKEAYFEAIAPLMKDSAIGRSLDLNGAIRYADYSSTGGELTWKIGGTYIPVDGVRFRGTYSVDIRAPNISELFNPGVFSQSASITVRNPADGILYASTISSNGSAGNPNLNAERAKTLTFGTVIQPISGLDLSVDYFDINLTDAISAVGQASAADLCNNGDLFFCNFFTFGAAGPATLYYAPLQNIAGVRQKGIEASLTYRLPLADISSDASGDIRMNVSGTYNLHSIVDNGLSPPVDRVGENSQYNSFAMPRARINGSINYSNNGFSGTVQANYVSSGKFNNSWDTAPNNTANINRVGSYMIWNLLLSQSVTDKFEIFGSARNIFNRAPPMIPHPGVNSPTNGQYYDVIGRYFTVGVRIKFQP